MILAIGPGGCGFTFLTWSIIYLRGDTKYTLLNKTEVEVTDNPLRTNIAHGQKKDHLANSEDIQNLNLATKNSVVYVVPSNQMDIDSILEFPGKKIIFNSGDSSAELFARMCCAIPHSRYMSFINHLSGTYNENDVKQVLIDCNKFFTKYYTVPDTYKNYFDIGYADIFQNLDLRINDIFEYIELSPMPSRLDKWKKIYDQYRAVNQNFLHNFLPELVDTSFDQKKAILKEVIKWKHGLYQIT